MLDPEVAALVERSRRLGQDESLVVHGGGNTSVKVDEVDHRGATRRVLRIKGSGVDLRHATKDDFPGVFLDDILPLRQREAMTDEEMTAYLAHCLVEPGSRRPSIETLLHGFLPAPHVDHVHADAVVALTNTPGGEQRVAEALGPRVGVIGYQRPGFGLAKRVAQLADLDGVVLAHHGLVTWGPDSQACLDTTLRLVRAAEDYVAERSRGRPVRERRADLETRRAEELRLAVRGRLGGTRPCILRADTRLRDIADRDDVEAVVAAGVATADHLMRIRPRSVVVRDPSDVPAALDSYERGYRDSFRRHADRLPPGTEMLEPLPRVVLVPGLGALTTGSSEREAKQVADIALHTHAVAAAALDAFGRTEPLSGSDEIDLDYWPLERAKLSAQAPAPELAGRVFVVTGAASGIGRTIARDLASRGAALVLGDLDEPGLESLSRELAALTGTEPSSTAGDLTDSRVVDELISGGIRRFGGLDGAVANAGIAPTGRLVDLTPEQWRRCLEVNTTSQFLLTRRVLRTLERQGLGGSVVFIASKNAFGPGAGFGAYSASKAAVIQLARVAAIEAGAAGIRVNAVNPDAVFDGSKLWSSHLREERAAAHGIAVDELEDYYAQRNVLGARVTSADVAESVAWLLSERSARTTGCVITVDGGVPAAFPR